MTDSSQTSDGRYSIVRELGAGGMGTVFEAIDRRLDRRVALKYLQQGNHDEQQFKLLLREARAAAKLAHPNVVAVHDLDQDDRGHFISMEYLSGGSVLDQLQETNQLSWRDVLRIAQDVCLGLQAAHDAGILHRDLKPGNLLISGEGVTKIADFGLVRLVGDSLATSTTGQRVVGTVNYMSPEACRSEHLDERSDLYSLGATCFHLLTGNLPFREQSAVQVMFSHCTKPVPDACEFAESIPGEVSRIVQRTMEKEPVERFQSASEMLTAIQDALGSVEATGVKGAGSALAAATDVQSRILDSSAAGMNSTVALPKVEATQSEPHPSRKQQSVLVVLVTTILAAAGWGISLSGSGDEPPIVTSGRHTEGSGASQSVREHLLPEAPPIAYRLQSTRHLQAVAREDWSINILELTIDGLQILLKSDCETMAFSRDSHWLAAACYTGTGVALWDLQTGKAFHLLEELKEVASVDFSIDGLWLAAGARDGQGVRLLNLETGKVDFVIGLPEGLARGVQFLRDGRLLVALEPWLREHPVFLWTVDVTTGQATPFLEDEISARIIGFPVSPAGDLLAISGEDRVQVFTLQGGSRKWSKRYPGSFPNSMFGWGGERLIVHGAEQLHILDSETGEPVGEPIAGSGNYGLAFSPNGELLAMATSAGLSVIDPNTGKEKHLLRGTGQTLFGLKISSDGNYTAAGVKATSKGGIHIWNTKAIFGLSKDSSTSNPKGNES